VRNSDAETELKQVSISFNSESYKTLYHPSVLFNSVVKTKGVIQGIPLN